MTRVRGVLTARALRVALVVLALLILVVVGDEVAARALTPTSMTYTETNAAGHTVFSFTSHDPATVAEWDHYVNGQPSLGRYPVCTYAPTYTPLAGAFTFTYHGVPLETFYGQFASGCHIYSATYGFIPDLFDSYTLRSDPSHSPLPVTGIPQPTPVR